jgi:hypothetical protein
VAEAECQQGLEDLGLAGNRGQQLVQAAGNQIQGALETCEAGLQAGEQALVQAAASGAQAIEGEIELAEEDIEEVFEVARAGADKVQPYVTMPGGDRLWTIGNLANTIATPDTEAALANDAAADRWWEEMMMATSDQRLQLRDLSAILEANSLIMKIHDFLFYPLGK